MSVKKNFISILKVLGVVVLVLFVIAGILLGTCMFMLRGLR